MIFNPSPLTREFIQARVEVDTLILNAQEAAALVSMTHPEIDTEPQRADGVFGIFPTIGNCGQKSRRRPMRRLPDVCDECRVNGSCGPEPRCHHARSAL